MSILPKGNLQIKCDPYESVENIFHRTQACNPKICIELEKANNLSNLEEEQQS